MKLVPRVTAGQGWLIGAVAVWSSLFLACATTDRAIVAPLQVPGATYVGTEECSACHGEIVDGFKHATHAALALQDDKGLKIGCEGCHGPGSTHVQAGGGRGNIINPLKNPETCFRCHLDKRGEFSLPHAHPVLTGHVTCSDCHEPHTGRAVKGSGTDLEAQNETCTRCHTEQKGPFVYEHGAMREGCVSCHNPHGSINDKLLLARDANLCLRCHLEAPDPGSSGQINGNAIRHTAENHNTRLMQGTCWSAGCHETPHGSNANNHLRY